MKRFRTVCLSLVVLLAACALDRSASAASPEPADTVLIKGGIYTVDAARPLAQAAALRGGRIVAVGSNEEIAPYRSDGTRVVDLEGRMALPGFIDSHVHVAAAGLEALQCPLVDERTVEAVLEKVARCARETPGEWIVGSGWDLSLFEGSKPPKELLDRIVPDRPVILWGADGHTGWANSSALALAGIRKDTPDPENGIIERDSRSGEPQGTLRETAITLVMARVPPPTDELRVRGLERGLRDMNASGITSFIEAATGGAELKAFGAVAAAGKLTAKARLSLTYGMFADLQFEALLANRKDLAGPRLDAEAIKIFVDGVLEGETAALLEPYLTNPSTKGSLAMPAGQLNEAVTRFDAMGLQVHMHAIGDAGVRAGLDAFAAARAKNGVRDNRHHISHLQLIDAADIPRFAALGVAANFQALWAYPDDYIVKLNMPQVGPERVNRMYPIGSVARSGGRIVAGSDWSVSTQNPLPAIQVALTRQDFENEGNDVLNAAERVDLPTMIAAYTINGAWLMHREKEIGSIEVGKAADIVVLERDLFRAPLREIGQVRVDLTLLDGEVVYQRDGARSSR